VRNIGAATDGRVKPGHDGISMSMVVCAVVVMMEPSL
jgi:hypothetical protein